MSADRREDEQSLAEIDRTARAYGFEIGRGRKIAEVVEMSDDNPFLDPEWRTRHPVDSLADQDSRLVERVDPPQSGPGPVLRDQLTTQQYANILFNTRKTKQELVELVVARAAHRAGGCNDWFCEDPDTVRRMDSYGPTELRQLLTMAVDRIARLEEDR